MFQQWESTDALGRVQVIKARLQELLQVIESKVVTADIGQFIRQVVFDAPYQRFDAEQSRESIALFVLESHARLVLNEEDKQYTFEPFPSLSACQAYMKANRNAIPDPENLLKIAFTVCVEGQGLTTDMLMWIERMDAHAHCHKALLDLTTHNLSEIPYRVDPMDTNAIRAWHQTMVKAQQSDDMHTKTKDLIAKYRIYESDFQLPETIPMCRELNPSELRYHLACARIVLDDRYQDFNSQCEQAYRNEESVFAFVNYFMKHEGVTDWLDICWMHFRWPFHAYRKIQGHLHPIIGQPREPPYILCLDEAFECIVFNDDGQPHSTAHGFYEALGVWTRLILKRDCVLAPRVACDALIERMLSKECVEADHDLQTGVALGPGQSI